jgi:hypothetical protein
VGLRAIVTAGMLLSGLLLNSPAQVQDPPAIPDSVALVKEVEAHQRQLEQLRENYTFRELQETDTLDSKGSVTNRSSEEREVFFVNRHRLTRVVKKDGKALSGKEEKSEQDRVKKLVEKAEKNPLDHDSYREGGDLELSRILAVMNISRPRRVTVEGRDTLAFDFTGDRHASAHGLALSAARKLSGTVWVDEADRQVARLEATLDDNFRLGAGLLATVQKGTWLRLEQVHVGQGLWLPSTSEVHVMARELIVKGLRENLHFRDFDFRRFEVGVSQKNADPRP